MFLSCKERPKVAWALFLIYVVVDVPRDGNWGASPFYRGTYYSKYYGCVGGIAAGEKNENWRCRGKKGAGEDIKEKFHQKRKSIKNLSWEGEREIFTARNMHIAYTLEVWPVLSSRPLLIWPGTWREPTTRWPVWRRLCVNSSWMTTFFLSQVSWWPLFKVSLPQIIRFSTVFDSTLLSNNEIMNYTYIPHLSTFLLTHLSIQESLYSSI